MINRTRLQKFLLFLMIISTLSACAHAESVETASPVVVSTRRYAVKQSIQLSNLGTGKPEKQHLWVALIKDFPPYQVVSSRNVTPGDFELIVDEFGNQFAEFDFSDHPAGTEISVQIEYQLVVNELAYKLNGCQGSVVEGYTSPELHIESANPQIIALSNELSIASQNACQKARSFYDYVATELVYSYNRNDWGAQAAVGPMGADCTEYSSLMIALSRAANIPARYFEGLLYLEERTSHLARTEHAWLDMYLPGIGWTPADPTLGRLPIYRENYFAHYTADHIIITMGRNPSTLRGASYWSHLYWPGDSTEIEISSMDWSIQLMD